MKKILITGHTGLLGKSIVDHLSSFDGYKLFGISKTSKLDNGRVEEHQIDLLNTESLKEVLKIINPDVIIHTAAFTNLSYCEKNLIETYKLHVAASRAIAEFTSSRLVYISTDSVFDGEKGNYAESDPAYPLNYYAHSKLEGEWVSLQSNLSTLVLRTNIYGFKKPSGNSLAEWALNSFREEKSIQGYTDVFFNPLYVGQLAGIILKLIEKQAKGLVHVGASENISKFAFLKALAETFGISENMVKESVSPPEAILRRPKNTTLSTQFANEILKGVPSLRDGLEMFKQEYLKTYEAN